MDINILEKNILVNLGVELNQRLTDYAQKKGISKASVVKTLLKTYLDEKERA